MRLFCRTLTINKNTWLTPATAGVAPTLHDLDHQDPNVLLGDVSRICLLIVQIQPRKHVLGHADDTAPTPQHEVKRTDHTDHTDRTDQEFICPERSRSSSRNR